jgi:hypothetical protein
MAEVTKNVNPAELARKAAALRQLCQHRHRPLLVSDPRFGVTRARLSVDDPHPATPRRRTLTDVQHVQLGGTPQRATPRVPDPQFPKKIPAGRRSRHPVPPAPGGQPDPNLQIQELPCRQPRWARCTQEGRLHLLQPAEVITATTQGHAAAVRVRRIPAEGLTITSGPSGALCMAGVLRAISAMPGPDPRATA